MMSEVTLPSPYAFFFVIEDSNGKQYDAFLDFDELIPDVLDMNLRYREVNSTEQKWTYLSPTNPDPNFQTSCSHSDIDTAEKTDAYIDRVIAGFNKVIEANFGKSSNGEDPIPPHGFERIKWVLRNGLKEQGNVLSRK